MITIAIDPGYVTGVAYIADHWPVPQVEEIKGREDFYDWLMERFAHWNGGELEVVIESYNINTSRILSPQYDALYIIGAVELLCRADNRPFFLQPPAMKSFGTNNKLKTLGWYYSSTGGHGNDACRHLLRHLVVVHKDAHLIKALGDML